MTETLRCRGPENRVSSAHKLCLNDNPWKVGWNSLFYFRNVVSSRHNIGVWIACPTYFITVVTVDGCKIFGHPAKALRLPSWAPYVAFDPWIHISNFASKTGHFDWGSWFSSTLSSKRGSNADRVTAASFQVFAISLFCLTNLSFITVVWASDSVVKWTINMCRISLRHLRI